MNYNVSVKASFLSETYSTLLVGENALLTENCHVGIKFQVSIYLYSTYKTATRLTKVLHRDSKIVKRI